MGRRAQFITVLAALFVMVVAGLLWWQAERARIQMRAELLAQAGQRSLQLADAMAGQIGALIANIDLGLLQLRREWTYDRRHFDEMARDLLAIIPGSAVTHISVADAGGNIVYNSLDQSDRPFVGDREHFRFHQSGEDRLHIGRPVLSRVTNSWSFVVNRPLLRNGRFDGTLNFLVRTDYVADRMAGLLLDKEDIVTLVYADDGAFLARSRDNTKAMGVKVFPDRPFLGAEAHRRGTFRTESTIDSAPRTFGWYRLDNLGLITVVGLDDNAVLAPMSSAVVGSWIRGGEGAVLVVAVFGGLIVLLLLRSGLQQAIISGNEERLRQVVRISQLGIFDEDHIKGWCFWSPTLRAAFDWKDGFRRLADFLAAVHPEDRENVAAAFRRSHDPAGDGQLEVICRALRADGRLIWLEVRGETFFEGARASRHKVRTVGASLDITARKAAETQGEHLLRELRERMEQVRLIIDNVPEMIAFYDSAQVCRFCNRAYAEARGYVQAEVVGRTLREVVGETRYALTLPSYQRALAGEMVRNQRERNDLGPNMRYLESALIPLIVNGGVAGVITMQINVTGREVAAEQLREHIRLLNEQMAARREAEQERDRMTAIIEATTDLVSMADPAGNVTYFNQAGRAMIAVGERPLSEIHINDVHPEWAAAIIMGQGIPAAVREGSWSGETALLAPGGREIPVSQVILSHKDDQGVLLFLSTI
ncbi:MAG: PAS domain S-box protein, partial [Burkholderiales bacterium]|nr:PAS domain S-box protein [Burkholderiales bacterium]